MHEHVTNLSQIIYILATNIFHLYNKIPDLFTKYEPFWVIFLTVRAVAKDYGLVQWCLINL